MWMDQNLPVKESLPIWENLYHMQKIICAPAEIILVFQGGNWKYFHISVRILHSKRNSHLPIYEKWISSYGIYKKNEFYRIDICEKKWISCIDICEKLISSHSHLWKNIFPHINIGQKNLTGVEKIGTCMKQLVQLKDEGDNNEG